MQDFASKASRWAGALNQQLICLKSRKLVRIMKITTVILLGACLQLSARGVSQTITLSVKDAPLQTVFKLIEKQTDYAFFFDNELLSTGKKVTINVNNLPLPQVLDICFKEQPFTYTISGRTITLARKKETKTIGQVNNEAIIDIRGRVVNDKGEPVLASISVKGSTKGATTNNEGWFVLAGVDDNATLIITGVGIETTEVKADGKTQLEIAVKISVRPLDEMQVIAYGQTTKRFQTGNVASVKGEDIQKQPVGNPLLALQGRVPGLFITQANGLPGGGVQVLIQGQNSIGRGNDPLYVIDGVPYISQMLPTIIDVLGSSGGALVGTNKGSGSPLSLINPSDIESIEVLKDADATAIYGSRAAGGAILITTKKGKAGQIKVEANIQKGWGKVRRRLDLLNTSQYLDMRHEGLTNDGLAPDPAIDFDLLLWDTTSYTDWQKALIGGTAGYTNIQTSVSGGTGNLNYLVGAGFRKETTVFPTNLADKKGSVHFNINQISPNQKFRLQVVGNYLLDNNEIIPIDLTSSAMGLPPDAPKIYNSDKSLNWAPTQDGISSWSNPFATFLKKYNNKSTNLISNAIIGYRLLPGLEVKSSFGYNNLQSNEMSITPLISIAPEYRSSTPRQSTFNNAKVESWIIEPQLTYRNIMRKLKTDIVIGGTFQETTSNRQQINGRGFNSDIVMEDINAAANVTVSSSINSVYKYNAVFGRFNFNWNEKYILNLTGRRDGTSRFGSKNQFHNFGSIGGAWIFSNSGLFKQNFKFISFGKLRASYGTTGNEQIGDYQFLNLYNPLSVGVPYQGTTALQPNGLPNPYLQWEETRKLQFGLELGLLADRLIISANYFRNRSSNQLLPYTLPLTTGFGSVTKNFPATVQNTGWELSFTGNIVKSTSFSWTTNINLTIPRNKLVAFPDLASSSFASFLEVGKSIMNAGSKTYRFGGVDEQTGLYQFYTADGKLTSYPDYSSDRTVLVNTAPKLYGGFSNTFKYKSFELSFLVQFVKQVGRNYLFGIYPGSFYNEPTWILNRWQKPGDKASIQRYNTDFSIYDQFDNGVSYSDGGYSDASFLRLKNISFSWQIPKNWCTKLHIQNLNMFIQAQNLYTRTNYLGLDPETMSSQSLPPLSMFAMGINISL